MNGSDVARVRVSTALGEFMVVASGRGLRAIAPAAADGAAVTASDPAVAHARAAADALRRYADGEPVRFAGALDVSGSPLERAVWERLRAIPFGATASYGRIARDVGAPGEARAIGAAVGANPICILVPCHRVVGADGSLRGFAWGLDLKRRLLAHEGSAALPLFEPGLGASLSPGRPPG
jgi:methylated-DNA-[protein]-cysteine S-methyltransferase